jgi:hypothetical protein
MNSNLFRGTSLQRGYGISQIFRRFFNWATPIFHSKVVPALSSVGKTAIHTAASIARDAAAGRNLKEATQYHINSAVDKLQDQAEKRLRGEGLKRKKYYKKKNNKFKKYVILKKKNQNFRDIFDS